MYKRHSTSADDQVQSSTLKAVSATLCVARLPNLSALKQTAHCLQTLPRCRYLCAAGLACCSRCPGGKQPIRGPLRQLAGLLEPGDLRAPEQRSRSVYAFHPQRARQLRLRMGPGGAERCPHCCLHPAPQCVDALTEPPTDGNQTPGYYSFMQGFVSAVRGVENQLNILDANRISAVFMDISWCALPLGTCRWCSPSLQAVAEQRGKPGLR